MVEKNVFSGEKLDSQTYGFVGNHKTVQEKLNTSFWNLGIQQLRNYGYAGIQEDDLIFEKITLVVYPSVFDRMNHSSDKLFQFLKTHFGKELGYTENVCRNRIVEILDEKHTSLFRDGVRYADYYPKRNCILLYFNPCLLESISDGCVVLDLNGFWFFAKSLNLDCFHLELTSIFVDKRNALTYIIFAIKLLKVLGFD